MFLKGNNRGFFENVLVDNIKLTLQNFAYKISKIQSRIIIFEYNENAEKDIINALLKVFGIHSVSPVVKIKTDLDNILKVAIDLLKDGSFKVETNRADKNFKMTSMDVSQYIGGYIFTNLNKKVDIHKPDYIINIDIRENGYTFVYTDNFLGARGIPVGCSGNGLLLLSGGIDSPVAGYMMASRGMKLSAVHFMSPPYTSLQAGEKVKNLAKKLSVYNLGINVFMVSFTEIQTAIAKLCPENYLITLMRRFMMRIANRICEREKLDAIITGESLGQVASQTIQGITCSNDTASYPVLRPLIGFDKIDIIDLSKKIDCYNISILPYQDCCTIFLPKKPVTKPKLESAKLFEESLECEILIEKAVNSIEILEI
ncbi:MAG: tRNA 4-thiouridine(8) synthase ThiI [Firmicutes bacterium]|nr:tRNA 4-thiouridine(8) synthase ThiI [Bacillota bacterium]